LQTLALILVIAAGLWLVGVAGLMALRPAHCIQLCQRMRANLLRSNWRVQFTEQGLRVLAGVALLVRAPASKVPLAFEIFGGLLVVTSVIIMLAPIRWHGTSANWWLDRLQPWMIAALSPVPAAAGAGVIYASI
jgi:hypothetical protein